MTNASIDEGMDRRPAGQAAMADDPPDSAVLEPGDDEEPPVLTPGERIAQRFTVVGHLSRGDALDVYDVWSDDRRCRCVAKLPRPDRLEHAPISERLLQEGRLLGELTHPHLVRAYEVHEDPHPVVILEPLTGPLLAALIERLQRRRLAALDVALLGVHVCSAVGYLHREGHLHLDLKPSNISSSGGMAKVFDLSLSTPPGSEIPAGRGTPCYMAPEQARGGRVHEAADVWGIGSVLYEAASGISPFDTEDDDRRYVQLERRAPPVSRHRRLPKAFAAIIDACLEPNPLRRPSVEEVAEALEGVVALAGDEPA